MPRTKVAVALLLAVAAGVVVWALAEARFDRGGQPTSRTSVSQGNEGGKAVLFGRAPGGGAEGRAEQDVPAPEQGEDPRPWHVLAKVQNVDGGVVAGAQVKLWLAVGDQLEPLGTATSGKGGAASLDLRSLASMSRSQLGCVRLVGHVYAPGFWGPRGMPSTTWSAFDTSLEPEPWSMKFFMEAAPVVVGRVLYDSGEPVRFAGVALVPVEGGDEEWGDVFTDPDGRYAVPAPKPGTYRVHVGRGDVESRDSDPITVDGVKDAEVAPLLLKRLPETRGVVRFKDGTPVPGLTFAIDHPWWHVHYYVWTPHIGPLWVRTDDRGEFKTVLPEVPKEMMLGHGREAFSVVIPGLKSEETGFDPTSQMLEVEVPGHRLRVRLRDAHAEPLRGQEVSFGDRWRSVEGRTDAHGEVSLFLTPGATGRLRVVRAGNALVAQAANVPERGNESVILIDVPDRETSGTVAFDIRTPSGETAYPVDAEVTTLDGDEVVKTRIKSVDDKIILPAGPYSVWLWSAWDSDRGWDVPDFHSGVRLEDGIVVRDRVATSIAVQWKATAALAMKITAPGEADGALAGSKAWLKPSEGERQPLDVQSPYGNDWGTSIHPNELAYSRRKYEPGLYELILEAQGYRTLTQMVRLTEGKITRVEVTMEREP